MQRVLFPCHAHVLRFNRDAALALEVHAVEVLSTHFTRVNRIGHLQNTVREG